MAGLNQGKSGNNVSSKFSTYPCGEVEGGSAAGETRPLGAQRAARMEGKDCGYELCPSRGGIRGERAYRLCVALIRHCSLVSLCGKRELVPLFETVSGARRPRSSVARGWRPRVRVGPESESFRHPLGPAGEISRTSKRLTSVCT